ncbi:unnamed protein product, partial [marine sediment metagenome]
FVVYLCRFLAYHKLILLILQIVILYYVYLKGTIITLYNTWLE